MTGRQGLLNITTSYQLMQKKDQKNQKNWEQAVAACSCILVYFSQQNELIEFIDYKMTGMDPVYIFFFWVQMCSSCM